MSMGHMYLGTIGVEGAYRAMLNGYVDEFWRGSITALYEDVKSGKVKAGKATGTPSRRRYNTGGGLRNESRYRSLRSASR